MLNPATLILRPATQHDALCLGVLGTQVFLDTYATSGIRAAMASEVLASFSSTVMRALLDRDDSYIAVAEHAGHLIGFVQLGFRSQHGLVNSSSPAELERLYVQARFTRQGVGALLLHHAEQLAASRGIVDLWLSAWVHNERALRFYAQQGYQDAGAIEIEFEDERHQNRVLSKCLASRMDAEDRGATSIPDPPS